SDKNNSLPLPALPEWQNFISATEQSVIAFDKARIIDTPGLQLDISAQRYSPELTAASKALLDARNFNAMRQHLLEGDIVNPSEKRAAWHSALRAAARVGPVNAERQRMNEFIRKADSERRWRNIVHIGIGGSDWGVRLAVSAFGYAGLWRQVRFVSSIDGHAAQGGLAGLDPRDTLVVLASKSFTTAETLQNGARAREWLAAAGVDPRNNFAAITAYPQRAVDWGVPEGNVFRLWEWVGGRFSLWSAVSLTTALAVSADVLAGLRAGAAAMDQHFAEAPPQANAPVRMALA